LSDKMPAILGLCFKSIHTNYTRECAFFKKALRWIYRIVI
jgi:hypothetical protein